MKSKDHLTSELAALAHVMVNGSLSEVTRQCGDPSCACATDPSRRHGPHLYLKFSAEGKAYSVYIPAEQQADSQGARTAWLRFNELASQMAAGNRERFLQGAGGHKRAAKAARAKGARRPEVIELCRRQLDFGDGLIAEEVGDLWEDWMRHVDTVLEDPVLLDLAYEALACRWKNSRTRGRKGTPVDVVVRLLVLKHMRNWSYAVLEREVRANLVYRQFTRIGAAKVPDAKTLGKLGLALGPAIIEQIHQTGRGDRPGAKDRQRAQDAGRHDRRRDQYPLPHRRVAARRRGAGPDAHDEAHRRLVSPRRRRTA